MRPWIQPIAHFWRSLAGRIAVILTVGMICASYLSLFASEQARRVDIAHMRSERVLVGAIDIIDRLQRAPRATEQSLARGEIVGAHLVKQDAAIATVADAELNHALVQRFPPGWEPQIARVPTRICLGKDPFEGRPRIAGFKSPGPPDCWLVTFSDQGTVRKVAIELWTMPLPASSILNPVYLVLIVVASAGLSVLVASLAMAPLRRLHEASNRFAESIDAAAIPEGGPIDVRAALANFNTMQARVREGVRERTRLLASISHDLQTPLTRLRYRLEQVRDEDLRNRLVKDLTATLSMVRRGLDLARSSETAEDWSRIDLDSLLSSIAEDAKELGHNVHYMSSCAGRLWVKPDALARCLGNLIDNAIKYAGGVEIYCKSDAGVTRIMLADHGPGLADKMIDQVFEPFVRGSGSHQADSAGTGIGLAIAKAQAATFGGSLRLANRPSGGLEATVSIPLRHR